MALNDGRFCRGCPLLDIADNSDMIAECLAGYWSDDSQFDIEASEEEGGLTHIRPDACIENNV